jgi:prepilin-type N-terminal cleavage/methylation domain-containing protein
MIARLRGRLTESGGYTLTEMIVVLAILLIVVGGVGDLFVSASHAEADMNNRFQAQQNARLALDMMRREIHCAKAISGTVPGSSITVTLGSYCPTTTAGATTDLQFTWCTTGSSGRFALWRYSGGACSGTGNKRADYLTTGTVFTTYTAPAGGNLGTLSIDLPVDLTPTDTRQRYELKDDIVLRNTPRS